MLRWLGTNGLRYLLQFWYSKQALFWLPQGWVPSYIEWLLAFPRAPTGSISIQVWGIACASIIAMLSDALVALFALVRASKQSRPSKQGQPMAFKSGTANPEDSESRKEL